MQIELIKKGIEKCADNALLNYYYVYFLTLKREYSNAINQMTRKLEHLGYCNKEIIENFVNVDLKYECEKTKWYYEIDKSVGKIILETF